jgi:hypothetical protein
MNVHAVLILVDNFQEHHSGMSHVRARSNHPLTHDAFSVAPEARPTLPKGATWAKTSS